MRKHPLLFLLPLAILSLPFLGCGGEAKPKDLPPLYPITVLVEQEGKPVPDASVSLVHADGDAKWSASCRAGADGVAKDFYTNGKYKGVAAGKFKVCVRKIEREAVEKVEIPPEPKDPFERFQWRQKYIDKPPTSQGFDLIEAKYFDPRLTKLEIVVTADGKNDFTIDAGKPVRFIFNQAQLPKGGSAQ